MPRAKVLHLNSPEDDEHTICGRFLRRIFWTLEPSQVTCKACRKVMK